VPVLLFKITKGTPRYSNTSSEAVGDNKRAFVQNAVHDSSAASSMKGVALGALELRSTAPRHPGPHRHKATTAGL
jgi:hypothetical protein